MNAETSPKDAAPLLSGGGSCTPEAHTGGIWSFDRFELDLRRGVLRSNGEEITLRPKTFALLCHLVDHPGRLVDKEELLDKVWPDVVVTEDSVVQCVGELRAALGDRDQRLIRTVPRRGYMLDATVRRVQVAPAGPVDTASAPTAVPTAWPRPRRRLAGIVLAGLLLAAGLAVWLQWSTRPVHIDSDFAAQRAVAILPFTDLSEPPSPALAEAVVEDLTIAVAQLSDTVVFARGSTAGFVGPLPDLRAAGRALGATHLLTGSVQRNGESVLIRAQLQRADNGVVIWTDRFEYTGAAHWNWQQDITRRIANGLDVRLLDMHAPTNFYAGGKPTAIEATQQGMYLLRHVKTREDLLRARALLETALAADPNSSIALSSWGATHIVEVLQRWSTDSERQIALAGKAFDRAIEQRPDFAMAYYGRSNVQYMRGQIDEAARACEQALARWPNEPRLLQRLGFYRMQQGQPAEAMAPVQLALRLNPLESDFVSRGHFYLGMALFHLRRDDEAYEEMRKSLTANPANGFAFQWMAAIDALHGRDDAAKANLAAFQKIIPGHTVSSLKATEPSKNAAFWTERERFYEGLRNAGLPP
jgi:DNA-binding winged helix-turn-helix (wHTH) protein/TolB-like protein/Flp pilus assembly protein TadD